MFNAMSKTIINFVSKHFLNYNDSWSCLIIDFNNEFEENSMTMN